MLYESTWQIKNNILTLYQHNNGMYGIEVREAKTNIITDGAVRKTIAECYDYLKELGI